MIDVQNVRKEFDGFAALGGATLTVPNGAVYGLVGPNGAGKSTLIRHITGIYRQDVGEITVDGRRFSRILPPKRASLRFRTTGTIFSSPMCGI